MLLMAEKGIGGGICHAIHRYEKANNNDYKIKNYDENKESLCIQHLDENNLYGWEMPQKLPVGDIK